MKNYTHIYTSLPSFVLPITFLFTELDIAIQTFIANKINSQCYMRHAVFKDKWAVQVLNFT